MDVELRFNGVHQLILIPKTSKEKTLLKLYIDEGRQLKLGLSKDDTLIIEAIPQEVQSSQLSLSEENLSKPGSTT